MTLRSLRTRTKLKNIGVYDTTEEDELVEETSSKFFRKFDSPETKKTSRGLDKYDFLCFFAKGPEIERKELDQRVIDVEVAEGPQIERKELDHRVIDVEVAKGPQIERKELDHRVIDIEVSTKEDKSRCELNGYGTDDLIDLDSDVSHGRIGSNLSASSLKLECDEASTGEKATNSSSDSHEIDSKNAQVLVIPDVIIYGDIYSTNSTLTFSHYCMNVQSSSVNATNGTFSCQWTIEDITRIESNWCSEVETAFVTVFLKSRDPKGVEIGKEISGVDLLKFSVCDRKWSTEMETIKLLSLRYKDIWFDTITENKESSSSGHNLGTSVTELADSFEDLVYPQGEADAVVITKQDIELLKPRRFINDTIIDFFLKYLKSRIPVEERGRFHFFNCFFFRKLANLDKGSPSTSGGKEAYQRVQKWTKNVDIFEKDYIFIPINCSFHWSLIIICHPGELASSHDENLQRVPCILHLDSIKGSHKGGLVNIFPSYLSEEWKARHGNKKIDFSRAPNIQLISLELPQQQNSFDCGLFLLHYLDLFVDQAPAKFNPSLITRSANFLTKNWFPAKEASLKRGYILELLCKLQKGHDPSILQAYYKSKLPYCGGVSNKNNEENEIQNGLKSPSPTVTYIPQKKTLSPNPSKESFNKRGYELKSSKLGKAVMSPIVEVQESGGKEEAHLPIDIEESLSQEMETLGKEECLLHIEDSDDDLVEFVPDSQDSCEEMKDGDDDDDDDDAFLVHGTIETKSDSASIKKRDSTAAYCPNNILVLSDDERSDDLLITGSNVMAKKRPKT